MSEKGWDKAQSRGKMCAGPGLRLWSCERLGIRLQMTQAPECIWKMDESYHVRQVQGIRTRKGTMRQRGFKERGSHVPVLDKPWGRSRTPW